MVIELFESHVSYIDISYLESLFLLSRNPFDRTRWFVKIQFFKFKQWAMARGWWWNTGWFAEHLRMEALTDLEIRV